MDVPRILIVEASEIICMGLQKLLTAEDLGATTLCVHNCDDLAHSLDKYHFDLAIIGSVNSLDALAILAIFTAHCYHPPCLMLLPPEETALQQNVVHLGAAGYISNQTDSIALKRSVDTYLRIGYDKKTLSAPLLLDSTTPSLTHRQSELLSLLAAGWSNRAIAEGLRISLSTVKTHLRNLFALFEASNRIECVTKARSYSLNF